MHTPCCSPLAIYCISYLYNIPMNIRVTENAVMFKPLKNSGNKWKNHLKRGYRDGLKHQKGRNESTEVRNPWRLIM